MSVHDPAGGDEEPTGAARRDVTAQAEVSTAECRRTAGNGAIDTSRTMMVGESAR
ncbi:MAG: hypothetical protein P4M00_14560 [Azospirillaceae bacterium]|nr:hypothetical protein [Azospirillaceae bacterium]